MLLALARGPVDHARVNALYCDTGANSCAFTLHLYLLSCHCAVANPKPDADQHQLLGRRLLQALIKVWGEKSKVNSGQRMCFYAQELNPKLGRARGLDLHSVAARLEQGLYEATGEPLQVRIYCPFCKHLSLLPMHVSACVG